MYKKAMLSLAFANFLILIGIINGTLAEREWDGRNNIEVDQTASEEFGKITGSLMENPKGRGNVVVTVSGQRTMECQVIAEQDRIGQITVNDEERDILQRIVEAEAGCENLEGKLLVANVVLNRVLDKRFPDTVQDVVFQRENGVTQFSPIADGRYWKVQVSEETKEAVGRALEGEDISEGALFFAARKYAAEDQMEWFDENLTFLFSYGGHEFFSFKSF